MLKALWTLFKAAYRGWNEDGASRLAAAISFYTLFSLSPVLVILTGIAGLVFGREAAEGRLVSEIEFLTGRDVAGVVEMLLAGAESKAQGIIATSIGFAVLFIGATKVFMVLQDAMNVIWDTEKAPESLSQMIKARLLSFFLIVIIGFLLIASVVGGAALTAFGDFFVKALGGANYIIQLINFTSSVVISTLLFAAVYKVLPRQRIAWRDVWIGATITAILFTIGKTLLGIYLGRSSLGSIYGAAGSVVVFLYWVYYSAQIFLFGVELSEAYSKQYGSSRP